MLLSFQTYCEVSAHVHPSQAKIYQQQASGKKISWTPAPNFVSCIPNAIYRHVDGKSIAQIARVASSDRFPGSFPRLRSAPSSDPDPGYLSSGSVPGAGDSIPSTRAIRPRLQRPVHKRAAAAWNFSQMAIPLDYSVPRCLRHGADSEQSFGSREAYSRGRAAAESAP